MVGFDLRPNGALMANATSPPSKDSNYLIPVRGTGRRSSTPQSGGVVRYESRKISRFPLRKEVEQIDL
jgi:hypothetical protein